MTKEEAVLIVGKGLGTSAEVGFTAGRFVTLLEKLGVLKLDEPKSFAERAWNKLKSGDQLSSYASPQMIEHHLRSAGLKIVEIEK